MRMKAGDKVTMIHGNVKGVVTRVITDRKIEIEDEHGFTREVNRSEYVLIHTDTNELKAPAENNKPAISPKSKLIADRGVYIAFTTQHNFFLLNNTDLNLMYSVFHQLGKGAGVLNAKSNVGIKNQSGEPEGLRIQCLKFAESFKSVPEIIDVYVKLSDLKKQINYRDLDQFQDKVYCLQLDVEKITPAADLLKTSMLEPANRRGPELLFDKVLPEIDLHEEPLLGKAHGLNASDIYLYQQQAFHKFMDSALACGHKKITIIHGAGNGRLREYIQRHLKKTKAVLYFCAAPLEKYGVGATEVHF